MLIINKERKRLYFLTVLFVVTQIVCGLGLILMIAAAVKEINQVARQTSSKIAASVIADKNERLGRLSVGFTWWDEAVDNVAINFDPEWADFNYGKYFYEQEDISHTLLIGSEGNLLYISVDGQRREPADFKPLAAKLSRVVARARTDGKTLPHVVHDYMAVFGNIFIITASAIVSSDYTYPGLEENRAPATLIIMKAIDKDFLSNLSNHYGLKNIRLEIEPSIENQQRLYLPLINSRETTVGTLSWTIDLPGNKLLVALIYSLGLVLVLLVIITVLFVKNIRRSNLALLRQNEKLITLSAEIEKSNVALTQLTYVDELTGVANRRKFDEELSREWNRCKRYQQPLALILIDIDYFKKYNDTYGHPAGDKCLQAVAGAIHKTLKRPADLVARYVGEEFVCLLPGGTDTEGARQIMENIRHSVEALAIIHSGSPSNGIVTISLGGTSMVPADDVKAARLVQNADLNLYKAKDSGRNCSVI